MPAHLDQVEQTTAAALAGVLFLDEEHTAWLRDSVPSQDRPAGREAEGFFEGVLRLAGLVGAEQDAAGLGGPEGFDHYVGHRCLHAVVVGA